MTGSSACFTTNRSVPLHGCWCGWYCPKMVVETGTTNLHANGSINSRAILVHAASRESVMWLSSYHVQEIISERKESTVSLTDSQITANGSCWVTIENVVRCTYTHVVVCVCVCAYLSRIQQHGVWACVCQSWNKSSVVDMRGALSIWRRAERRMSDSQTGITVITVYQFAYICVILYMIVYYTTSTCSTSRLLYYSTIRTKRTKRTNS